MGGKLYLGVRGATGVEVTVTDDTGRRALPPRNDLINHSPDGFEFGFGGSGPSQLALALCCDALGDDARALSVYQAFKWDRVAGVQGDEFSMTADEVRLVVSRIEHEVRQ